MLRQSFSCSSLIVSGGAKRIISPCVGLAIKPFSFNRKHTSQASKFGLMTMAFSKPLPRTIETTLVGSSRSELRSSCPIRSAFSANFSSTSTWRAAIATLQPSGFPPYVEPCSPG
uniref:Uncharacterized protein n=1 Tax=Anopheles albimanus TaxID=7167 RepID=A0A182FYI9_ANOAL